MAGDVTVTSEGPSPKHRFLWTDQDFTFFLDAPNELADDGDTAAPPAAESDAADPQLTIRLVEGKGMVISTLRVMRM